MAKYRNIKDATRASMEKYGTNSGGTFTSNDKAIGNEKFTFGGPVFRSIPEKMVLVKFNKFTGRYSVSGEDMKFTFVAPWQKTTLLSNVTQVWNYSYEKFDAKDDTINIDMALSILIVDPIKYMSSSNNVRELLGVSLRDAVRKFVYGKSQDDIKKNKYTIREIDSNNDLLVLEQKCGIKIEHLHFENIKSSVEVEKARARKLIAEQEKSEAEIRAEIKKVHGDAESDIYIRKLDTLISMMKKQGLDNDQITAVLEKMALEKSDVRLYSSIDQQVNNGHGHKSR